MTTNTTDALFARLSHRFSMSPSVAKKATWLFNSQWPHVHELNPESIQDALQVIEDTMTPPLWRESKQAFQAAVVLLIHEHLQQFDLVNVAQLIEQFPEFQRLDVSEKLQLIEFRNLMAPAITVFDHKQKPEELFIVVELLCGLDNMSINSVMKRQHRALVFSRVANYKGVFSMAASFVKYFVQELFDVIPVGSTTIATSSTATNTATTKTTSTTVSMDKRATYRSSQTGTDSDGTGSVASFENIVVRTTQPLHPLRTSHTVPSPITLPPQLPHFQHATQASSTHATTVTVTPAHAQQSTLTMPSKITQNGTQTESFKARINDKASFNALPAAKLLNLTPSLPKALLNDHDKVIGSAGKKRKYDSTNNKSNTNTTTHSVVSESADNNDSNITNYIYNPTTNTTTNTAPITTTTNTPATSQVQIHNIPNPLGFYSGYSGNSKAKYGVTANSSGNNNTSKHVYHSMPPPSTAYASAYNNASSTSHPYTPHTAPHNAPYVHGMQSMQQALLDHLGINFNSPYNTSSAYNNPNYHPHIQVTKFHSANTQATTASAQYPPCPQHNTNSLHINNTTHSLPLQSQYPAYHTTSNTMTNTTTHTTLNTTVNNAHNTTYAPHYPTHYPTHHTTQQRISQQSHNLQPSSQPSGRLTTTFSYYIPNPLPHTTRATLPHNTHTQLPPPTTHSAHSTHSMQPPRATHSEYNFFPPPT